MKLEKEIQIFLNGFVGQFNSKKVITEIRVGLKDICLKHGRDDLNLDVRFDGDTLEVYDVDEDQ